MGIANSRSRDKKKEDPVHESPPAPVIEEEVISSSSSSSSSSSPLNKELKRANSLYGDKAIKLSNFLSILRNPSTRAVRIHGSRHLQSMFDTIKKPAEVSLIIEKTSPSSKDDSAAAVPVVCLISGDEENTRACAGYINESWAGAVKRAFGSSDGGAENNKLRWIVSNHSYAVATDAVDKPITQSQLPAGCTG